MEYVFLLSLFFVVVYLGISSIILHVKIDKLLVKTNELELSFFNINKKIESLRPELEEIHSDLQDLREVLEKTNTPPPPKKNNFESVHMAFSRPSKVLVNE